MKGIECEEVEWIHVAYGRVYWSAVLRLVTDVRV